MSHITRRVQYSTRESALCHAQAQRQVSRESASRQCRTKQYSPPLRCKQRRRQPARAIRTVPLTLYCKQRRRQPAVADTNSIYSTVHGVVQQAAVDTSSEFVQYSKCSALHNTRHGLNMRHKQCNTVQHLAAQLSAEQKSLAQHATTNSFVQYHLATRRTVPHRRVQHCTAQHSTVPHRTAQNSTVSHCTVQFSEAYTVHRRHRLAWGWGQGGTTWCGLVQVDGQGATTRLEGAIRQITKDKTNYTDFSE